MADFDQQMVAGPPVADSSSPAQSEFEAAARTAGYDPADPWIGGYTDYEWDHLRLLLDTYGIKAGNARVLEFGCNVGASSIVMAALGARVDAIDVDPSMIRIARANVARHKADEDINIQHSEDTRNLPYGDATFDLILANSVLEYVPTNQLDAIIADLARVLKPGGQMLICGTASRLAPQEVHSRRWLVNYVPKFLDRLIYGKAAQRGLSPLLLSRVIKGRFVDASGNRWAEGRKHIHGKLSLPMRVVCALAGVMGTTPGWLGPNIELLLKRSGQSHS